ncbi:MAG TPA: hypothetical protein VD971_06220 [Phycisphaerales bacterium]|nr:hypothetical protein [Phycisphaerales bacterium]
MAGRTSASTGVTITIVILSIFTVGFFIAFAIFFSKFNDANGKLEQMRSENQEIIGAERNRDDVRALIERARQSQRTLVGYLAAQREETMQRMTGDRRDTLETLESKLSGLAGSDQPLLSMIQARETELAQLRTERDQLVSARDQALANLKNEQEHVATITASHKSALDAANAQIQEYAAAVSRYREGTDAYQAALAGDKEKIRTEANETEDRLNEEIRRLTEEKLILEAQVASLRGTRSKDLFRGPDEATLVDAQVIGVNNADRTVVIGVGRRQNAVLGMAFSVYNSAAAIRANDAGEYPAGKATIEVINVGETTSTCRITSELRGNPIVRGDVVANAIYDPNKQYRFVVYGAFDSDRDGLATPGEQGEVESMIRSWGGTVTDQLAGDVDFLVLGTRPVLPPRPAGTAPVEVALEYTRRLADVERYDMLLKQAQATGMQILTENRLYTLTGRTPAPIARR